MRLEREDLEDPGLANAYRMEPKKFKERYLYLFDLHKALFCDVALARQRKRAFVVLARRNVALGYYVVAPLGRFGELRIIILSFFPNCHV